MVTKEQVEEALTKVKDPELGLDIISLGLVYEINIKATQVEVVMTLTFPGCPYGPELVSDTKKKIKALTKGEVSVTVTFDPPWELAKISDEAKLMLGMV